MHQRGLTMVITVNLSDMAKDIDSNNKTRGKHKISPLKKEKSNR